MLLHGNAMNSTHTHPHTQTDKQTPRHTLNLAVPSQPPFVTFLSLSFIPSVFALHVHVVFIFDLLLFLFSPLVPSFCPFWLRWLGVACGCVLAHCVHPQCL